MGVLLNVGYSISRDFAYLMAADLPLGTRLRLFCSGQLMFLQQLTTAKLLRTRTARFMGLEIEAFHFRALPMFFSEIFLRQEYAFKPARPDPFIIDCGANIGACTLFFKWRYPKSRVVCIEPDPTTFALLSRNLARNRLSDVQAHQLALGDHDGSIDFFVDDQSPGSALMSTKFERMPKSRIQVPCRRLSELIGEQTVDFLKMDIEGSEWEVMADLVASQKLGQVREMAIEYHHKIGTEPSRLATFLAMLEQAGFEYQLDAQHLPPAAQERFQDVLIRAYRREAAKPAPSSA